MSSATTIAAVGVAALALAHVLAGRFRFVTGPPRAIFLSVAGGMSVAYVFVHLLPDVAEGQEAIAAGAEGLVPWTERHAYLLALVGLAVFYGAERAVMVARRRRREREGPTRRGPTTGPEEGREDPPPSVGVFRLHVGLFALYSSLIGYLVVQDVAPEGPATTTWFVLAIGAHFVVNDAVLREHHPHRFDDRARWLLVAALALGWVVGAVAEVSEAAHASLLALLSGAVILNVLKEEVPAERESRFWAFAVGAAGYTALLLAF